MGVQVTREDPKEAGQFRGLLERCEAGCNKPTRYWWAGGCMPVCQECAQKVSRQWCIDHARKHGFGPLPSRQYYLKRKDKLRRNDEAFSET